MCVFYLYYEQQAQILSYVSAYILNQVQTPVLSTNWLYLYTDSCLLNQGTVEQIVGSETAECRTINNESDGIDSDKPNIRPVGHHFELNKDHWEWKVLW